MPAVPLALLLVYLSWAPNVGLTPLPWHDEQRIEQLVVLSALVIFSSRQAMGRFLCSIDYRWLALTCLFFLLGGISALLSSSPKWAGVEVTHFLLLTFGIISIASTRIQIGKKLDSLLLYAIAFSIGLYSAATLVAYYAAIASGATYDQWLIFHGFSNIRTLGHWQTLTLPLVGALLQTLPKNKPYRKLAWALLVLWWALLLGTGTRGSLAAIAVGWACVMAAAGQASWPWFSIQLKSLIGGVLFYLILFHFLPDYLGVVESRVTSSTELLRPGLTSRELLWNEATHFMATHPWLGIGPMQFACEPNAVGAHPHNFVFQVASEWGIPAAIVSLIVIGAGMLRWGFRLRNRKYGTADVSLQLALFASVSGGLAQSLVDGVLVMPYGQTLFVLVAGWALGANWPKAPAAAYRVRVGWGFQALALLSLLYCLWAVAPSAASLLNAAYSTKTSYPVYVFPRFWAQGWIDCKR